EFFDGLQGNVDASKTAGVNATYQFDIGDNQWHAVIADGSVAINEGPADNPTITLSATEENWLDLVNGKINGQTAFLTGKLKIQGDMTLAMKLESVFQLG
ncbi:MAG TPA: SCP2 sterol-binding domain-containing protein, partial [Candidatus Hydrogenedentes bacterium]|nr:SCP2 sterol-binding domain-containing protein [Candidatus Hydrogenedentota bacterium]